MTRIYKLSPFLAPLFALVWFLWLLPAPHLLAQADEPLLTIDNVVSSPTTALDAGDTVTYTIRITHKQVVQNGNLVDLSTGDAFNVNLITLLPANLSNIIIASALITDGVNASIDVADAFTIDSGNQLLTTAAITLAQATAGPLQHQVLTVKIVGQLDNNIQPGATILASEAYLTWQDSAGQMLATYQATGKSATLPITGALNVTKSANMTEAAIGSLITYSLTVSVIEGTTANLHFTDTLPTGLTYLPGSLQIAQANGMTITGVNATLPTATRLDILLAAVTNPGNVDNALVVDTDQFVLTYQVNINNRLTTQAGSLLPNDVDVTAPGVAADLNNKVIIKAVEPKLRIAKAAANPTPKIGETVQFTITVDHEKISNATAYDVVITDTIPAGMNYVPGSASLPAAQVNEVGNPNIVFSLPTVAENSVVSFTYTATMAAPGDSATLNLPGMTRTNQLFATWTSQPGPLAYERTGSGGGNDYYTNAAATVTVTNPDLWVSVSDGNLMANPGSLFTYTLYYTNTGNHLTTGVVLTASVPAQTVFNVSASTPGWVCTPNHQPGSVCSFAIGTLNANASGSKRFVVTVNPGPFAAGVNQIHNDAEIRDNGINGVEPTPANNHARTSTYLNVAPELQISLDDGGIGAIKGKVLTYTLAYTNAGNQDAASVVVTETVPANSVFQPAVSAPGWVCAPNNQAGSHCRLTVGVMNSGVAQTATFVIKVDDPIPGGVLTIVNTAVINDNDSNRGDLEPANNQITLITPIILSVDLTISQQLGPSPVLAGDPFTYQLTVGNPGPDTAASVIVTDTLPQNATYLSDNCGVGVNLAPWVWSVGHLEKNATATCTITVMIAANSTATITNVVQVANLVHELQPGDNSTSAATAVWPPLRINEVDYDQPGVDTAEFIELKNTGLIAINLNNVWVDLIDGASGGASVYRSHRLPNQTLAPGDYFVLCGNAATTPNCDLDMPQETNRLQNGVPGAIAVRLGSTLLDVLSYGGDTVAPYTEGTGATPGDNEIEAAWGLARTPDGYDSRNNQADFQLRCVSPGTANVAAATQCAPRVTIHKTVTPAVAAPGQPVTYTLTFSNSGNAYLPATSVVITDQRPTQLNSLLVAGSNVALTPTGNDPVYAWQTVDLWPGNIGVITLTGQMTDPLTTDTIVTNVASSMNSNGQSGQLPANSAAPLSVVLPRVSFLSANYNVSEDRGIAFITVTLTTPNPYASVTVNYASDTGTATPGSDYTPVSGVLTIPAGQPSATFSLPLADDQWVEENESIQLILTTPVGAVLGATTSATLMVVNDDLTSISIADSATVESHQGQTTAISFTLSLSHPSAQPVSVLATTADATAIAFDDYRPRTAFPVSFPPGALTSTVTVPLTDDQLVEDVETFMVNLSSARFNGAADASRVAIADSQAIGTIGDEDQALLAINDIVATEGDAGLLFYTFTVQLNAGVDAPVTVDFVTSDASAIQSNNDYLFATGTLTFAGIVSETQQLTVAVQGDTLVELDETFLVNLSNVQAGGRAVLLGDSQGEAIIATDDIARLSIDDVSHTEGNPADPLGATPYTFTVTLADAVDAPVTVTYQAADGTALSSDHDYAAATGVITFTGAAGEPQTIMVLAYGDEIVELDETFQLLLSNPQANGRPVVVVDGQGIGAILNDDLASFAISDVTATEGNSSSINYTFIVSLSHPVAENITVTVNTIDGSATGNRVDYRSINNQALLFAPYAALTQTVTVRVTGESLVEYDETFSVNLSNPLFKGVSDASRLIIADGQGLGVILNDDIAHVTINDVSRAEGNGPTTFFTFTVALSNPVAKDVTVQAQTAVSSALGSAVDYRDLSTTLVTFRANSVQTRSVIVTVVGEQLGEKDETFFVNLANATFDGLADSSHALIQDSQGIGTILNDDIATIAISDFTLTEGDDASQNFVFTVTLDIPVDADVTLDFATADATAMAADGDYLPTAGSLIFSAYVTGTLGGGPNSQTVSVTVPGDTKVELDEHFMLNLNNLDANGRTAAYAHSQGQGIILNEDSATITIGDAQLLEGNASAMQMTFPVTLDAVLDSGISINYATADGSASTADLDYTPAAGTLSFVGTAGETHWLTVTILSDNRVELDEQFAVNLHSLAAGGRAVTVTDSQGSGLLQNDDAATISLSPVTNLEANGPFGFVVQLSNPVDTAVTAKFTTADGTATASDNDYLPVNNQTVTLLPGETNKVVPVTIVDDNKVETDEEFVASLNNLVVAQRNVTPGVMQTQGRINNDDSAILYVGDAMLLENEGALLFTATLSAPSVFTVTATYSTTDGTAQAGVDYSALTALLSIPPGITSAVLSVPMLDDGLEEENETIYVQLNHVVNAEWAGEWMMGVIINDDTTPQASNDTFTTTENSVLNLVAPGVLGNDQDANGDNLSAILESTTTHGSLTLRADGSFVYTPTTGYFGADSFTYRASDGLNVSPPATATLTIAPLMQISTSIGVGIAGIQPACTNNSQMQVPINTKIIYCYRVKNTGSVPFLTHTLLDSQLGLLLNNFVHELPSGATFSTTATATLSLNAASVATWTATVDPAYLGINSAADNVGETAQPTVAGKVQAVQSVKVIISGPTDDQDQDTIPDNLEGSGDADEDNIPNFLDLDSDGDTIPDRVEGATDVDGDQTANFLDLDSDGDTLTDQAEAGANPNSPADTNNNGTADFLEALTVVSRNRYIYLPVMRR